MPARLEKFVRTLCAGSEDPKAEKAQQSVASSWEAAQISQAIVSLREVPGAADQVRELEEKLKGVKDDYRLPVACQQSIRHWEAGAKAVSSLEAQKDELAKQLAANESELKAARAALAQADALLEAAHSTARGPGAGKHGDVDQDSDSDEDEPDLTDLLAQLPPAQRKELMQKIANDVKAIARTPEGEGAPDPGEDSGATLPAAGATQRSDRPHPPAKGARSRSRARENVADGKDSIS